MAIIVLFVFVVLGSIIWASWHTPKGTLAGLILGAVTAALLALYGPSIDVALLAGYTVFCAAAASS